MSRKRRAEEDYLPEEPVEEIKDLGEAAPSKVRYKIKRSRIIESENAPPVDSRDQGDVSESSDEKAVHPQPSPAREVDEADIKEPDRKKPAVASPHSGCPVDVSTSRETTREGAIRDTVADSQSPEGGQSEVALESKEEKKDQTAEARNEPSKDDSKDTKEKQKPQQVEEEAPGASEKQEAKSAESKPAVWGVSNETSPDQPLFNVATLAPPGETVRTPFSARKPENVSLPKSEGPDKLEAFPQLAPPQPVASLDAGAESPEHVSTPTSRPHKFLGEENEETEFADFNATLLKCVNTAASEEKPVFKYRQMGTGVVRVLKEKADASKKRIVFRQSGTWQVYLNSPLHLVGRVENVDQSTSFAVKFTAFDANASVNDQPPKFAPFCIKLPDAAQRKILASLLSSAG
eukprot:Gregarina_sp_Pseudo_9__789@NODE_1503_length_1539_cov_90_124667_g1393_i0_p1_GENE_NODE_1503_length_1539_cov_90_124667_g1393_i0NODE_1503_length_1539_cov_90_124667_g1393_i0_p1_ORF_typecomplete_len405_score91_19Ran_BP1/PF00638_18/1_6e09_NODE_1503_length_1539_cov_90_124667_g1393_i01331347